MDSSDLGVYGLKLAWSRDINMEENACLFSNQSQGAKTLHFWLLPEEKQSCSPQVSTTHKYQPPHLFLRGLMLWGMLGGLARYPFLLDILKAEYIDRVVGGKGSDKPGSRGQEFPMQGGAPYNTWHAMGTGYTHDKSQN